MFGAVRRGQLLARSLRTSSLARPALLSSAVKSPLCVAQTSAAVASLSRKTFATSATQWAFGKQMRRPGRDPREPRAPREPAQELKADEMDTENQVTKFQDLVDKGLVSSKVIDVITRDMGLETLTDVQRQTINATLDGTDNKEFYLIAQL
ncbi:hypothetical protein KEM56_000722 [Ascosphaera pollenicola]|nr:hypothetical protein KEM56_000722 [Ascosphaera pollenicola]